MNDHDQSRLSAAGMQRRERMLEELTTTMQRVHRTRRLRRRVASGAFMIVAVVLLAVLSLPERQPIRHDERPMVAGEHEGRSDHPAVDIRIVRTDPSILDRYVARPTSRAIILSDEQLLDTLAAIDRPAGLIRSDGRVRLTANVVDPREDDSGERPEADAPSSL